MHARRPGPRIVAPLCLGLALGGCGGDDGAPATARSYPVTAMCEATVNGVGTIDTETDYLPHVINCENGGAPDEALKALAVSARSVLYYKGGTVNDGTSDQVYSCGREPQTQHYAAVEATSGLVLRYQDTQVCAFYVAGAIQDPPTCLGSTNDPTGTEHYVTYNEGLSGTDLTQSTIGWVNDGNYANRGCMSQNGSSCLDDIGYGYEDILRYYYGEDIEIVRAEGSCVVLPEADAAPPPAVDAAPAVDDAATETPRPDAALAGADDSYLGGCAAGGRPARGGFSILWLLAALGLARSGGRRRSTAGS